MKIESHNITYVTAHEFSYEKSETFKETLSTLSFDELNTEEEVSSLDEVDMVKRLKYTLILKLLEFLSSKYQQSSSLEGMHKEQSLQQTSSKLNTIKTMEIECESTHKESESIFMQTQGVIQTQDGKSIEINLDVTMQRSFYSQTTIAQSAFTDPLVISFDGKLPQLEDTTFSFDIDCDGKSDQISCLDSNSGFLALDTNNNGIIDNGSELFGTKSGNAFKDLSEYDKDANSWIDENDDIFEGLRIWSDDKLLGLGEVGIGAIYLGASQTPYTYKNEQNESLGKLRQSSIFLYESGEVGTVAQVDFVKHEVKDPLSEALAKV